MDHINDEYLVFIQFLVLQTELMARMNLNLFHIFWFKLFLSNIFLDLFYIFWFCFYLLLQAVFIKYISDLQFRRCTDSYLYCRTSSCSRSQQLTRCKRLSRSRLTNQTKPNQTKPNQTKPNQTKKNYEIKIHYIAAKTVVAGLLALEFVTLSKYFGLFCCVSMWCQKYTI